MTGKTLDAQCAEMEALRCENCRFFDRQTVSKRDGYCRAWNPSDEVWDWELCSKFQAKGEK